MAHNHNYICIKCYALRRSGIDRNSDEMVCHKCGGEMIDRYYRWRFPKKKRKNKWKKEIKDLQKYITGEIQGDLNLVF